MIRRILLLFVSVALAWLLASCASPPVPATVPNDPAIDSLLGGTGRQELAARIQQSGGTWEQYAAWGKELYTTGFVEKPPVGSSPSPVISKAFTCNRCHNLAREDPVLTGQNPEARLNYIEQNGSNLILAQGTTLWGAVNRVSFYNDWYAKYRGLCVPETTTNTQVSNGGPDTQGKCKARTRAMNPTSFEDAIQICSGYCSVGRYLLRWELDAMLAYFWDQGLHLSDLNLTPAEERQVRQALVPLSRDPNQVAAARDLLTTKYLRAAGDTYRDIPTVTPKSDGTATVGSYPNGETFVGDAKRGQQVYARACLQCHGTAIMPVAGRALVADVGDFYKILAEGRVKPDQPYMPEYTLQRLSRQQSADIQAYLEQLAK